MRDLIDADGDLAVLADRVAGIRPLAITASAAAALPGGRATIVAVHRRGVVVRGEARRDLVFVGAPGDGLVPLQVVLRAGDLARLADEAEEGTEAPAFALAGVRTLDWRCGRNEALAPPSSYDALAPVVRELGDRPTGLGATVRDLLGEPRWRPAFDPAADGGRADVALRSLIGRGAGSTPAGDDLVIGALAFALATDGPDAVLVARVRALAGSLDMLTTATGATYLRAALRGRFGSHLHAFAQSAGRVPPDRLVGRAARVASHGATSGIDTLAGFVAAAQGRRLALARGR